MTTATTLPELTAAQGAAVAKLVYAADRPGTVAVLCGPEGVGKTTVLRRVVRTVVESGGTARLDEAADVAQGRPPSHDTAANSGGSDVLLLDDAERLTAAALRGVLEERRRQDAELVVVLAGSGRLLSTLAADPRLERLVHLRIAVPAFTRDESSRLVAARLPAESLAAVGPAVMRTIHEIAAGIPATVTRLADMAALLVDAYPARELVPDDIETLHRRLSLHAA